MADIDKGLPVRTEDDADEKIQSKIVDHTTASQGMEVDTDGNAHVEVHGDDPGGTDRALRTSEQGHASVDGIHDGTNNTDPSNIGLIGHSRNATPGDSQQTERLTSVQNAAGDTRALDVSMHLSDGEAIDADNPLPVSIEESAGTEVHDFDEGVDVAAGGTSNHDYSVANGDVFKLWQIVADASGRGKFELQIGDGATTEAFTTKAVWFIKEDGAPNDLKLSKPIKVTGTVNTTTVRVIRTNRDDDDAQSIYTTIVGVTN